MRASPRRGRLGFRFLLLILGVALGLLSACTPRLVARPYVSGLNQPRGMAFDAADNLYVAETGTREKPAGDEKPRDINHSGRVLRISPDRETTVVMDGLPYTYYATTGDVGPADVVTGDDALYVLVGIEEDGDRTTLLDGLNYPTALAFAPNGDLYVAIHGAFSDAKKGAILRLPCRGLGNPSVCGRRSPR